MCLGLAVKLRSPFFSPQFLTNHMRQGCRCNMRLKAEPHPGQEIPRAVTQLGSSSLCHPQGHLSATGSQGPGACCRGTCVLRNFLRTRRSDFPTGSQGRFSLPLSGLVPAASLPAASWVFPSPARSFPSGPNILLFAHLSDIPLLDSDRQVARSALSLTLWSLSAPVPLPNPVLGRIAGSLPWLPHPSVLSSPLPTLTPVPWLQTLYTLPGLTASSALRLKVGQASRACEPRPPGLPKPARHHLPLDAGTPPSHPTSNPAVTFQVNPGSDTSGHLPAAAPPPSLTLITCLDPVKMCICSKS